MKTAPPTHKLPTSSGNRYRGRHGNSEPSAELVLTWKRVEGGDAARRSSVWAPIINPRARRCDRPRTRSRWPATATVATARDRAHRREPVPEQRVHIEDKKERKRSAAASDPSQLCPLSTTDEDLDGLLASGKHQTLSSIKTTTTTRPHQQRLEDLQDPPDDDSCSTAEDEESK